MAPIGRFGAAAAAVCAALLSPTAALPPPEVEFIGRAPKLRIYPGGKSEANETWIMLTFGKIEELDARGGKVQGRSLASLAAEKGIIWTQENRTVGGAEALVTRMELPLSYGGNFKETCAGGGGGDKTSGDDKTNGGGGGGDKTTGNDKGKGARLLSEEDELETLESDDERRLASPGSVAIEIFVFQANATVDYGDYSIEVQRGQLKFNIESSGWPFCGTDHKLDINMEIKVKGDKPPKEVKEKPEEKPEDPTEQPSTTAAANINADINTQGGKPPSGGKKPPRGKKPKMKTMRQNAGKMDMDLDFPEVVLADGNNTECGVVVDTKGGKTTIIFTFEYFEDSLVYDPMAGFVEPDGTTETTGTTAAGTTAAPGTVKTKKVVSGSMKMTVEDPAAFCANPKVIEGLKQTLARASKQNAKDVEVECTPAAVRRLESGRRLAGAVDVKYDITIPEGIAAPSAEETIASIQALPVAELTAMVAEELAKVGVTATVTVTEAAAPAATTVTYTETTTAAYVAPTSSAPTHATLSVASLGLVAWAISSS